MLLQADGIDVNLKVSIVLSTLAHVTHLTASNLFHWLRVATVCPHFPIQSPLVLAVKFGGFIEIVAMLLQAKGIDVNQKVISQHLPTPSLSPPYPSLTSLTYPHHCLHVMSVLIPLLCSHPFGLRRGRVT